MRKSIALVIVALLIVPAALAVANTEPGTRTSVYLTADNSLTDLARAYLSGCYPLSYCNEDREIQINISASIAQWARISLNATDIVWRVLKPGDYYIDGIQATLQSNGDLYVDYEGFEDLVNGEGDELDTYYAFSPGQTPVPPGMGDWVAAADLNKDDDLIQENMAHNEVAFTLYNRIIVGQCDNACEYEDPNGATITVVLREQKDWIWEVD